MSRQAARSASRRADPSSRPGFVDIHSHSDLTLLSDGRARSKVAQGVTTEINGNCGMGPFPLPAAVAGLTRAANATIDPDPAASLGLDRHCRATPARWRAPAWRSTRCRSWATWRCRIAVAGEAARPLDGAERTALVAAIERCLDDGAVGVSTGLMYPPAMSADLDELVAIGRAVARHDGCSRSTCATTATTCSRRSTRR